MQLTLKDKFDRHYSISSNGCWEWFGCTLNSGYGAMNINKRKTLAHRISWTIHFGEIPKGLCVLHKCNNKKCVNPDHLYLGTNKDNYDYAFQCGAISYGSRHPNSKIDESAVKDIRKNYKFRKVPARIFADKYNISIREVIDIVKYRRWKFT